jgi:hypothetical protein
MEHRASADAGRPVAINGIVHTYSYSQYQENDHEIKLVGICALNIYSHVCNSRSRSFRSILRGNYDSRCRNLMAIDRQSALLSWRWVGMEIPKYCLKQCTQSSPGWYRILLKPLFISCFVTYLWDTNKKSSSSYHLPSSLYVICI